MSTKENIAEEVIAYLSNYGGFDGWWDEITDEDQAYIIANLNEILQPKDDKPIDIRQSMKDSRLLELERATNECLKRDLIKKDKGTRSLNQEISDLKAKNKDLEEQLVKIQHAWLGLQYELNDSDKASNELLDALEETTKIHCEIVKGFPVTFKDYLPLIESNQALITKYRG